ncbi:MAG TPA: protein kinase, partial [Polyangiaceae bacterium]|nr:protein kinase [Polyangiaceae bacterium]
MASDQRNSGFPLLKATIVAGVSHGEPESEMQSVSATPRGASEVADALGEVDIGGTLDEPAGVTLGSAGASGTSAGRTTVLPRRKKADQGAVALEERPRFAHVRTLGQGAMGQVDLARDNDIRRTVAVKRLLTADAESEPALLRFADEVRIVGQLEHPGIVPVYDVGRDVDGQVYLVMKHLHGET